MNKIDTNLYALSIHVFIIFHPIATTSWFGLTSLIMTVTTRLVVSKYIQLQWQTL